MMEAPDPNLPGVRGRLFGMLVPEGTAATVVLPVPWDVTASYGSGAAEGPAAVVNASAQLDLYDPDAPQAWKTAPALALIPEWVKALNDDIRNEAIERAAWLESGAAAERRDEMEMIRGEIEAACGRVAQHVCNQSAALLRKGKRVAVLGGDHSCALGLITALSEEQNEPFGVLQLDAHMDLREAYMGYRHSHASIMRRVLELPGVERLVQVGIRDCCEQEAAFARASERVRPFFQRRMRDRLCRGAPWQALCREIVAELPGRVYVSFDVDALDPVCCPGTGTPVPGGLEFEQALYLVEQLGASGRRMVGFDLCEVAPDRGEWDANVGARLLFRLNLAMHVSNKAKEDGQ